MKMASKQENPIRKKVLVVDDHPIMRQGLTMLIEQEPDLTLCGEAEDAHEAMEAIERLGPDVAIVDISLRKSNGIELIKDIRIRWPELAVLVLSCTTSRSTPSVFSVRAPEDTSPSRRFRQRS